MIRTLFETAAKFETPGIAATRAGLVVVLVWIGGLKAFPYEDEGIVPFVANSPFMSFFYHQPAGEYRQPALGSSEHGFPFLSGAGRLVVKDAIMAGAALVTMADSAKAYLRRTTAATR